MVALSTSASAVDLESEESKISYMIGMDIGQTLQRQGKDLDLDALVAAIKASYEGGELAMSAEEAAAVRQAYISQMQEAQASQQAASALSASPNS